ncbi:phytanoyl-CoA dioxygenase family protein [Salinisphaera hydrothermalis]|uniref:Phytanoyl-CoA dioxygenase n=1 Tax=Salinisphaera hydrothermalis (strain C41B8) TaxID=1304275 RepID=A0A084IPX4_SALHC|nr:phytanoyl-CoA dioxygenase family protein [Salinisphaera hydrothermalis]KEZ78758.1 phytanoyl-CoA dioxygenase [Salinisphaera hydrothermalis C41B8]
MNTSNRIALQPQLTPAQSEAFARDGYLIMRRLANAERIAAMRSIALTHLEQAVEPLEYEADVAYPGAPASRSAAGGDTVRRLLDAYERDHWFADWAADERLTAIIAQLLDSAAVWLTPNHHNCVMTKAPAYSSATAWHRDLRYWSFAQPQLINAWLALGDETPDNGCMRLLPGSHRMTIDADRLDEAQFLREDLQANTDLMATAENAELAPGDVLFFHAGVFHAAGANHGDERKMAVVTSYFGRGNAPVAGTRSARRPAIQVREESNA